MLMKNGTEFCLEKEREAMINGHPLLTFSKHLVPGDVIEVEFLEDGFYLLYLADEVRRPVHSYGDDTYLSPQFSKGERLTAIFVDDFKLPATTWRGEEVRLLILSENQRGKYLSVAVDDLWWKNNMSIYLNGELFWENGLVWQPILDYLEGKEKEDPWVKRLRNL